MHATCHRCCADLPDLLTGRGAAASTSDDERAMFCPRCGAPQIQFPAYLRVETAVDAAATPTTGTVPPPRPQLVDWPIAMLCILPIALLTAVFAVASELRPELRFLVLLAIFSGATMVLSLYRSRRPVARINGKVGLRIGFMTGVAMVILMWIGLVTASVIERFLTKGLGEFDRAMMQQKVVQIEMAKRMSEQFSLTGDDAVRLQKQVEVFLSPEGIAGTLLVGFIMQSGLVVLMTTGLGGLAGFLQTRRRPVPRGD